MEPVLIKDLRQGMKNFSITFIVLEVGNAIIIKENREVRTIKVADATACINLSLWGEPGQLLSPGDIVRLTKANTNIWRNCLTLNSGKAGDIEKVGNFCMVFNEQLNMSDPNLVLEPSPEPAGSNVLNNGNINNGGKPGRPGNLSMGSNAQKNITPRFNSDQPNKSGNKMNNNKGGRGGSRNMGRPERR